MFERFIDEDTLPLFLSGGRYIVDVAGTVYGRDGTPVPTEVDEDGDIVVTLDWINGYRKYKCAVMVVATYKNCRIPLSSYRYIIPMFVDGNRTNLCPDNIVYRYGDNGVEHPNHKGFYLIPFFSQYVIDRNGVLFNTTTKRFIKHYVDRHRGFYRKFNVRPDLGKITRMGRYRLMCLAFKKFPATVDELDVNHIDGVVGNDTLDNLEWATRKRNMLHASEIGLRSDNIAVESRNVNTGRVDVYYSLSECCRQHDITRSTLLNRLRSNDLTVYRGGYQFKLVSNETPWPEIDPNSYYFDGSGVGFPISVKNVVTGEVTDFDVMGEATQAFGVTRYC